MMGAVQRRIKSIVKKIHETDQKGVALIVSLLVLLILVLLGLALILQSQTEWVLAVNENDSFAALSYAESALEWSERKIKDLSDGQTDLDLVLAGPDDTAGNTDDNLIGIRTLDPLLTLSDLDIDNEQDASVMVTYDWNQDNEPETYEAFRVGKDTNGDGKWDGPRGILYVRIDDNYDDPANSGLQDVNDEDWRARVRVMADYPIYVDGNGVKKDPFLSQRGIARRILEGKFGPANSVAIRTNKNYLGEGSPTICGACGGVHSNGDMEINGSGTEICTNATATGDYDDNADPTVGGIEGGGQPEQFIPTINPYDDLYVPSTGTFNHNGDAELAFAEPGLGTALQCGPPAANDPGASKYFALVFKKTSGQQLQVYKAYWDFAGGNARWLWRLIEDGPPFNAVLDNCGRLVSSAHLGLGADPCPAGNIGCDGSGNATYGVSDDVDVATTGDCYPGCLATSTCIPDGIIDACDAGTGDAGFYGLTGNNSYTTDACTTDDSLTGTAENDFNRNDFYLYGGGNNGDSAVPALPGTFESDGQPDFVYSTVTQKMRQIWNVDTGMLFSPLYNSVLFVFGNMNFNGDMEAAAFRFYDHNPPDITGDGIPEPAGTYTSIILPSSTVSMAPSVPPPSSSVPNQRWRVSPIAYGRVESKGTPRFAPANGTAGDCDLPRTPISACFMVGAVAGRDLDLGGGAGTACADPTLPECNMCPDLSVDPTADCATAVNAPLGYEGMFLAHEQVNLSGSSNIAGFLIAEEAAYCVETNAPGATTRMNGTPDIYYDCESPPDPWANENLRVTSWEEIQ